ncbi:hypothetical protein CNECB9_5230013 [Cupriavidus necator]|uniref:Uncharacterized protein n=1 Tax=Cupriavidus necator TaxID=106590 RepID=A0A1K0J137_CUPNE|nr:hypothetical protein CNECB9_5230013 [Cupriavidus necator]
MPPMASPILGREVRQRECEHVVGAISQRSARPIECELRVDRSSLSGHRILNETSQQHLSNPT